MDAPPSYEQAILLNPVVRRFLPVAMPRPSAPPMLAAQPEPTAPPPNYRDEEAGSGSPKSRPEPVGSGTREINTEPNDDNDIMHDVEDKGTISKFRERQISITSTDECEKDEEAQNPYLSLCCEAPFLIVYLIGYFRDDAAKNVKDNEYTNECTTFPDIFLTYFIFLAVQRLFAFYWYHNSARLQRYYLGIARCYTFLSFGGTILMIYVQFDYWGIDSDCRSAIKEVGSSLFMTTIDMVSIIWFIYLILFALGCSCGCIFYRKEVIAMIYHSLK